MTSHDPNWVPFATIARAHGVRGELRVVLYAHDVPLPKAVSQVRAVGESGTRILTIKTVRPVHRALLVQFEEIEDRDAARELAGAELQLDENLLPQPEPGETYLYELEGATVRDEEGVEIGIVRRVVDNHGQDLLEIDTDKGERLLPFIEETIVRFDRASRTLVIRPLPGLWD